VKNGKWKLKRTAQCKACPWRVETDPHDIPNGYDEKKHRALSTTIAKSGDISGIFEPMRIMACHESGSAHCVGWLVNQLGPGNNIPLRITMSNCSNAKSIRLRGEQHERFEDTLP
jgi:hypothetical protein